MSMAYQHIEINVKSSDNEQALRKKFLELFNDCPIAEDELLSNLGLFINRQALSGILYLNQLYQQIINVNGVVFEFGVRWGQNLALFESFRGMYEPHNYTRRIIGFDTFSGFPSVHAKDGNANVISKGAYAVCEAYEEYLSKILDYHEHESPIAHIKKYELVKGDASTTVVEYLRKNPETIVALAYFDFDLYEPTRNCLEAIKPHITKGTVIAFDELNCPDFPGETLALKEVFGLDKYRIIRSPFTSYQSYIIVE